MCRLTPPGVAQSYGVTKAIFIWLVTLSVAYRGRQRHGLHERIQL
jgi:hypothetical protein